MDPIKLILRRFEQISAVPRGTKREAELSRWLQQWADSLHFPWQADEVGNLVIRVPATPGYADAPAVVLQGHMDMVCEKASDSAHDFLKDPIRCIVEGEWMRADGTTLGADNGIAIALAMSLAENASVPHPPLELLFTVEEEVGIGGANHLQPGFVTGKILLNLDSEDEGVFIVGCAGGQTTRISLPLETEPTGPDSAFLLRVTGLQGGHSGVDIHKHRANANKLLGRVLYQLRQAAPIQLMDLQGGTAHNAIPREAWASFACAPAYSQAAQDVVQAMLFTLRAEYAATEPTLALTLEPAPLVQPVTLADTARIIRLLAALPHGVAEMSASVPGFVETSSNLATVELKDGKLNLLTSQRSVVMSRLVELTNRITAIAELAGAHVASSEAYPAWQPDMASPLLKRCVSAYQSLFGMQPDVKMIHAGLECGVIGAIYPGMDMISLGVTIQNPHSPHERMHIPAVGRMWQLLVALLKEARA